MNETTLISGLAVLVGLFLSVGAPMIKLNSTITTLNVLVKELEKKYETFDKKNSESHGKIWCRLDEHDDALNEHDKRLLSMERQG